MTSYFEDLTSETFTYILKQINRKENKKRLHSLIETFTQTAVQKIQPYMYAIMAILVLLFIMNCFQFYYYIRFIIQNNIDHASV